MWAFSCQREIEKPNKVKERKGILVFYVRCPCLCWVSFSLIGSHGLRSFSSPPGISWFLKNRQAWEKRKERCVLQDARQWAVVFLGGTTAVLKDPLPAWLTKSQELWIKENRRTPVRVARARRSPAVFLLSKVASSRTPEPSRLGQAQIAISLTKNNEQKTQRFRRRH